MSESKSAPTSLDIILPCYNPPENWEEMAISSFKEIQTELREVKLKLIVVNDGSVHSFKAEEGDRIAEAIAPAEFELVDYSINKGKGYALRQGMQKARGDFQIYTDIDFPYEHESLIGVFQKLKNGEGDVVAGTRDDGYYLSVPPIRKAISKILRWTLRNLLLLKITDTQCGLKGFNEKGKVIFLETKINRFLFDLEFIFLASTQKNIRVIPAIVKLRPHVVFSKMNWKILAGESFNFLGIFFKFLQQKLIPRKNRKSG